MTLLVNTTTLLIALGICDLMSRDATKPNNAMCSDNLYSLVDGEKLDAVMKMVKLLLFAIISFIAKQLETCTVTRGFMETEGYRNQWGQFH